MPVPELAAWVALTSLALLFVFRVLDSEHLAFTTRVENIARKIGTRIAG